MQTIMSVNDPIHFGRYKGMKTFKDLLTSNDEGDLSYVRWLSREAVLHFHKSEDAKFFQTQVQRALALTPPRLTVHRRPPRRQRSYLYSGGPIDIYDLGLSDHGDRD